MVSEREAEVISILSSFLLAVPPSPAGLAKLFLFESRLPEALKDLIRRGPCAVRGGCIPNAANTGRTSITANHPVHLPLHTLSFSARAI
jgi:hypothetical protein